VSLFETVSAVSVVRPRRRPRPAAALQMLPDIAPGQLWLVEAAAPIGAPPAHDAAARHALARHALARHAVDGANVVVYDRALAPQLEHALPLGTYAEPAPAGEGLGDPAAARCVRFARDGWSVARLMPARLPRRERLGRIHDVVAALAAARVPGNLRATVLAEAADGIGERTDTSLDGLADIVATYERDTCLAILIEAFGGASIAFAAAPGAVANGLAG
jgi:hypothetical protein